MSFKNHNIRVVLHIQKSDIVETITINSDESGENKLFIDLDFTICGGATSNMSTATIYGLSYDTIKKCMVVLYRQDTTNSENRAEVYVDDALAFKGNIHTSIGDFSDGENPKLVIRVLPSIVMQAVADRQLKIPEIEDNFSQCKIVEALQIIAVRSGLKLHGVNSGTSLYADKANNPLPCQLTFEGSNMEIIDQFMRQFNLSWYIHNDILYWGDHGEIPASGDTEKRNLYILPKTSYPQITDKGINIRCEYIKGLSIGCLIKPDTIVPYADSEFAVAQMSVRLSTRTGEWFCDLECYFVWDN